MRARFDSVPAVPHSRSALLAAGLAACLVGCSPAAPPPPPPPPAPTTAPAAPPGPPGTDARPVSDSYHGVEVVDPYRWLESSDDAAVKGWVEAQNHYSRSVLDGLPAIDALRARIAAILEASSKHYSQLTPAGGRLFALLDQPPKQQPLVVVMSAADAPESERVVLDPNALDPSGHTAVDWFVPSPDGKLVAVSLSKDGTESGDVHVYETDSGKQVHEVVPRVNGGTAGGSLAWAPGGAAFFYSRYPRGDERPEADRDFYVQIYLHRLGTPTAEDRYELGKDFPRIAEIELRVHQPTGRLLATVQKGDGGEFALYLRAADGKWMQFSDYGDRIIQAAFGSKNDLYLLSRKDAPRGKIEHVRIADLALPIDPAKLTTVIAEGQDTVVDSFWAAPSISATSSRIYVLYQLGGPSEIRVFDLKGKPLAAPQQLEVAAAAGLTPLAGEAVLFEHWSFVEPPAWYHFDPTTGETRKTKLVTTSPVDLRQTKVVREMAVSKDGTKVPVNILMPAGVALDGKAPAVVNGYGGYGVSITPRYRATYGTLLEQGVIYAIANLRGGGEFGESWHRQGNLTNKQNVFDDFAAVLQHLVKRGYTSSDRLGIIGGSNGGLLMGASMVQHPELAHAVVSFVGIYDMLRVELSPNGAFNVTEFGTVKDPAQFAALYAYSPYHHVTDGVAYPATLLLTGENDPRVDPMQSRKMAARLQAATAGPAPVLLRVSASAGHGGNTALSEQIEQLTDAYSFLFAHLGVSYQPVVPAAAGEGAGKP